MPDVVTSLPVNYIVRPPTPIPVPRDGENPVLYTGFAKDCVGQRAHNETVGQQIDRSIIQNKRTCRVSFISVQPVLAEMKERESWTDEQTDKQTIYTSAHIIVHYFCDRNSFPDNYQVFYNKRVITHVALAS